MKRLFLILTMFFSARAMELPSQKDLALQDAVSKLNVAEVQRLLEEEKADPNTLTTEGGNALDCLPLPALLTYRNAPVSPEDNEKAQKCEDGLKILDLLLKANARVNKVSEVSKDIFDYMQYTLYDAAKDLQSRKQPNSQEYRYLSEIIKRLDEAIVKQSTE